MPLPALGLLTALPVVCCQGNNWAPRRRTTRQPAKYDCAAGLEHWQQFWEGAKKEWCCEHEGQGCPKSTPQPQVPFYDCERGFFHWQELWGYSKKGWCCEHAGRGCPDLAPTQSPTFDCDQDADMWNTRWSSEKQAWCCQHAGRGCMVFDCDAGLENFETGWSQDKKEWCCRYMTQQMPNDVCCPVTGSGCPSPPPTGPPYDCDDGYAEWATTWSRQKIMWCCENAGKACPDPVVPVEPASSTETTTIMEAATTPAVRRHRPDWLIGCDLNCFGAGAKDVNFTGQGNVIAGLSREDCRERCYGTELCEAVTYTDQAGPPRCYGKRDIHTSKCQPGDGFQTDVMNTRLWGKCALMGDPHLIPFDRPFGPTVKQVGTGVFHLIKARTLQIQARYANTTTYPEASSTTGLAVTGKVIHGHTLVIEYTGSGKNRRGFRVFWDNEHILSELPSTYVSKDKVLVANFSKMEPSDYHRSARSTIGNKAGPLPSYLFELGPDLRVYMLLGSESCNVVIEARRLPDGQDGYCGNFNCNQEDDSMEGLSKRGVAGRVAATENLFELYGHRRPAQPVRARSPPAEEVSFDCDRAFAVWEDHWGYNKRRFCCERHGRGCMTKTPVVLSCDLNCFGEGAKDANISKQGHVITGLSREECRQKCYDAEACDGVAYNDQSDMNPSVCYGKHDIHTSKCQPGEGVHTDIIGVRPWGKCALMGDPHILTFDRPFGPTIQQIGAGEFYLVKASDMAIQARYGPTRTYPTATSTTGLAVAGEVIQGHTLVVEYVGPERGYRGFQALWDDEPILPRLPSTYISKDKVLVASLSEMEPSDFHRSARSTIGGKAGLLPSYLFELGPNLKIYMLLGPESCNIVIEAQKRLDGQDGYCGNFNCNQEDDSKEELARRGVAAHVLPSENLFEISGRNAARGKAKNQPSKHNLESKRQVINACDPSLKARAQQKCSTIVENLREDCVFDACAANSTKVIADSIAASDFEEGIDPAVDDEGDNMADAMLAKKFSQMDSLLPLGLQQSMLLLLGALFLVGMLLAGFGLTGILGLRFRSMGNNAVRGLSRGLSRGLTPGPSRMRPTFSSRTVDGAMYDSLPVQEEELMDTY